MFVQLCISVFMIPINLFLIRHFACSILVRVLWPIWLVQLWILFLMSKVHHLACTTIILISNKTYCLYYYEFYVIMTQLACSTINLIFDHTSCLYDYDFFFFMRHIACPSLVWVFMTLILLVLLWILFCITQMIIDNTNLFTSN